LPPSRCPKEPPLLPPSPFPSPPPPRFSSRRLRLRLETKPALSGPLTVDRCLHLETKQALSAEAAEEEAAAEREQSQLVALRRYHIEQESYFPLTIDRRPSTVDR
jgi:hypothetical protein